MRTVLYVVGFAVVFWIAASLIGLPLAILGVGYSARIALYGAALVAGGIFGWRRAQRRGRTIEAAEE